MGRAMLPECNRCWWLLNVIPNGLHLGRTEMDGADDGSDTVVLSRVPLPPLGPLLRRLSNLFVAYLLSPRTY